MAGQFDTTFIESRFALSAEEGQEQRQAAAIAAAILAYHKRQVALAGAPVWGNTPETSAWKDAGRRQGLRGG